MRNPYLVAGAGLVIAIAVLAGVLAWLPPDRQTDLVFELAKAAAGTVPVVFVSVFVADLIRRRDADKAAFAERARDVDTFRLRAIDGYNQTKAIRRALRAHGLRPDATTPLTAEALEVLDARMLDLSLAQLTFEQLKREAAGPGAPFRASAQVSAHLEEIEKYLNRVLKEWEAGRPTLKVGAEPAVFENWRHFKDFVSPKKPQSEYLPDNPKPAFDALEAAVLIEAAAPRR